MTAWWGPAHTRLPETRRRSASASTVPLAAVRNPVDLEIVIPASDESARLPMTLAAMVTFLSTRSWYSRVVVVDNGSSDDTAAVARALSCDGVEVVAIGCAEAGRGAAVLRGLRTSSARWVGFTDAALSTPLATLGPAVEALQAGAAAAIASRRAPGSRPAVSQLWGRRLGGQVLRSVARPLVPGVHDTQCGFTFFDRIQVQAALAGCRATGFAFDVDLVRQVHAGGGRIVEIPVIWTDDPKPSLRPVRDGAR